MPFSVYLLSPHTSTDFCLIILLHVNLFNVALIIREVMMECLVTDNFFSRDRRTCCFQVPSHLASCYLSFHDSLISIQNGFKSERSELDALAFVKLIHELNPMQTQRMQECR